MKSILLTFDLEEFDLPREYDQQISEEEMYVISEKGLNNLLLILNQHNIKATFFTTTNFAKKFPEKLKKLSETHEIASHSYSHSHPLTLENIKIAKEEKERIIGKPIKGFRAPRFEIKKSNIPKLANLGFTYDSSIHPTIAPGKYLNINQKREVHKMGKITEIPPSTLPLFFLRAPNNWYMFRNFPKYYHRTFPRLNFLFSDYTMALFHPWEFTDLTKFNIPLAFKNNTGKSLMNILNDYIILCKKHNYNFKRVDEFLEKS